MKLSELIKLASEYLKEHGDLDVCVYADHGQSTEFANFCGIQYLNEDNEAVHEDDIDDYDDLTKVIEIAS
jgi:hypothetical protein